jgi:hypothetical protein
MNTPAQHMPGPWQWRCDAERGEHMGLDGNGVNREPVLLGKVTVDVVTGALFIGIEGKWEDKRLIEAAPELLAACEAIAALEVRMVRLSADLGIPFVPTPEVVQCRNAVAKAKGGLS